MPARRSLLQDDVNFRILRLLQDNPEWSQRELAKAVGISNGGVHYVLTALLEKGLIKLDNFKSSSRKKGYAYVLTPRGLKLRATATRTFLMRKIGEYEALRSEIRALQVELGLDEKFE